MKKRYICEIDGKLMYICEWCGSVHELSDLKYESKLGFMCEQCITAVESRGEILVFEEVSNESLNNGFNELLKL